MLAVVLTELGAAFDAGTGAILMLESVHAAAVAAGMDPDYTDFGLARVQDEEQDARAQIAAEINDLVFLTSFQSPFPGNSVLFGIPSPVLAVVLDELQTGHRDGATT